VTRLVNALAIVLLGCAGLGFSFGVLSLSEQRDLHALYWLAIGGLLLRSAVDLLRPGRSG
jgi:hypothetical protein